MGTPPRALLLVFLTVAVGLGLGLWVSSRPVRQQSGPATGAPAVPHAGAPPQGHVYTGVTEEPERLNPFTVTGGVARRYVLGFTHDTLLDTDPRTGELRPALAVSWRLDQDGLGFTCELRRGVRFADGTEMTPEDVLFTWQVAGAEQGILGSMGDGMRLVHEARLLPDDPWRLHVRLKERHFAAVRAVAESWLVVSRAFFAAEVARLARQDGAEPPAPCTRAFADLLAKVQESGPGTGPYRLGCDTSGKSLWRKHLDLRLMRNEHCWRRAAHPGTWNLDGVRLLFLKDDAAIAAELRQRNLDWYMAPEPQAVLAQDPGLAADYRIVAYDYLALGTYVVVWNHRRPGLADPRVRRALGMLFDRQAIAGPLLGGTGMPAVSYFKPGTRFYPPDLEPLPFDPGGARRLLREAGFDPEAGRPLRVRILAPVGPTVYRRSLDLALAAGNRAGVQMDVQVLDWQVLASAEKEGDWDGLFLHESHRTWVDPYDLFHSGGGGNRMGFADAETDALLERFRTELDEERRVGLAQTLNRRLHELQPIAFLAHPRVSVLFNAHIRDAEPGVLGLHPERWWVPPEHQRR